MDEPPILVERHHVGKGEYAVVTLNRPRLYNALSYQIIADLQSAIESFSR
jgi:enoyl-CoA hydratase/carnithine racemase